MKYLLLAFVILGAVDCVVGWYLDLDMRFSERDVIRFSDGSLLMRDAATALIPKDAANTLAQRGTDPKQIRIYATYTDSRHSGFFVNTGAAGGNLSGTATRHR